MQFRLNEIQQQVVDTLVKKYKDNKQKIKIPTNIKQFFN